MRQAGGEMPKPGGLFIQTELTKTLKAIADQGSRFMYTGQWGQDFVNAFGGYINNPNATVACQYCQYAKGDEFFLPLNIQFSQRWRDAFILFSYFGELLSFPCYCTSLLKQFIHG